MRNRCIFWISASLPLVLIIGLRYYGVIGVGVFLTLMACYVVAFRPMLHIWRMYALGKTDERRAWKFFLPFYHVGRFKTLWWDNRR